MEKIQVNLGPDLYAIEGEGAPEPAGAADPGAHAGRGPGGQGRIRQSISASRKASESFSAMRGEDAL